MYLKKYMKTLVVSGKVHSFYCKAKVIDKMSKEVVFCLCFLYTIFFDSHLKQENSCGKLCFGLKIY